MTTKNKNAQVAATNIENIENENKEVVNMEQVQEATEATEATKVTETTEATEAAPSASIISKAAGFKAVDAEGNELGIVTMQELQDTIASQVLEMISQRMQANTLEEPAMLAATASAKAASDAFENQLTEQSDFQWVRTLDADGNSTRVNKDNFSQVVGALTDWSRNISIGDISSTYHILPQKTVEISKEDSGNKTFTITICKRGGTDIKPYAFRLISLPTTHFSHAKAGFVDIVYNARNEASFVCSNTCGNISNVREITHNGAYYLACDVDVNQYGSNTLYIVGLHADLSEIMDVTGSFSEVG